MSKIGDIFIECSKYTLDKWWIDIFMNCSVAKYPTGFYPILKDNDMHIRINYNKKSDLCIIKNINNSPPTEIYVQLLNIFKNKLKMSSSLDVSKSNTLFDMKNTNKTNVYLGWNDVKSKLVKNNMIHEYCLNNTATKEECEYLNKIIKIGIIFKSITADDIKIQDNKIISIGNIIKNDGNFSLSGCKNNTNAKNVKKENPYKKQFEKYLCSKAL